MVGAWERRPEWWWLMKCSVKKFGGRAKVNVMFWISRFVERENTSENICSFERAETQCKRGCNFDELFLKEKWCSSTLFLKEKEKEIKARENANHNGDKHRFVLHQILRPHFDERTFSSIRCRLFVVFILCVQVKVKGMIWFLTLQNFRFQKFNGYFWPRKSSLAAPHTEN